MTDLDLSLRYIKSEIMYSFQKINQKNCVLLDHIIKQHVYEKEEPFAYSSFFTYLTEICDALDVPTPVLLKTHIMNYAKFNTVTFRPADYMEEVPFQKMVLENIL